MVAATTRRLPEQARRVIDEAVTADAVEQPAGKAIAAARARVAEADEHAEAMAARAAADRRVFLKPMDDGVAMVGAVLPAEDALRAYDTLDVAARVRKHTGDPATLDHLRCEEFTAAITTWLRPAAPGTDTSLAPAAPGTGGRALPHTTDEAAPDAHGPPPPTPLRSKRPVSVQVVISLTSLLGLDSKCGWLDGYGAITPGVIRRIAASGDITLTRLLCDPATGAVVVADPTKYRPTAATTHAVVCRDTHCRLPVCTARVRHLDHAKAFADGGLTTTDNLQGLCERSHLAKSHPGWAVTGDANTAMTWHTPTGHRYTSLPPPATGYGTGPPAELDNPLNLPEWLSHTQRLNAEFETWRNRPAV